jgi:hypothetical protein
MHAAAQPACPMHEDTSPASEAPSVPEDNRCVMRGVCNGPMTALAALMMQHGVLPDSTSLRFDDHTSLSAWSPAPHPIVRTFSPDTPPPKFAFRAA